MRKAFLIAGNIVIRMTRDKHALMISLLVPLVLIAILGTALNGMFKQSAIKPFEIIVVNKDIAARPKVENAGIFSLMVPAFNFGNTLVKDVLGSKQAKEFIITRISENLEESKSVVQSGKAAALIYIPKTFTKAILAGDKVAIKVLSDPAKPIHGSIIRQIVGAFAEEATSRMIEAKMLGTYDFNDDSHNTLVPKIIEKHSGTKSVSAMQYYAVAMSIMFLFMSGLAGGVGMLQDNEDGTTARLLVSPTKKGAAIAGRIMGNLAFLLLQFTVMVVGTRLLFKVYWGELLQTILLGASFCFAATGIGTAVASFFDDSKAADSVIGIVGTVSAAISGAMMPIYIFGPAMKMAAKVAPNYWSLQGFLDQMSGAGISSVWTPAAVLLLMGLTAGVVGTLRFGREH